MSYDHDALENGAQRMEKSLNALKNEFANIRAGRANPQLLNKIKVDYYGTATPLAQMSNIAVPEPRVLTISLWDTNMIKDVEKAILASDLGLNPTNDGKIIRLVFPELTAERRKELVKQAQKKSEEMKVAMRNIRRDILESLKKDKKASEITEDDYTHFEKQAQELTDGYIKKIDATFKEKEAEIMEI